MNKVVIVILVWLSLCHASFGQTQKGYLMAGGDFGGFTYNSSGADNKSYNFNISPSIGYYVADRLAVGAIITVGVTGVESADGQTTTNSNYGISPFIRYYFTNDPRDKYFIQGKFNGGGIKQTGVENNTYAGYGVGLGYNHFFVKIIALEIGLGYDFLHPETGHDENNFGVNLGLQIFLPTRGVKAAASQDGL